MADGYKTEDGKIFSNRDDAQAHANQIAKEQAKREASANASHSLDVNDFNKLVRAFNEGRWDDVIRQTYNPYYEQKKSKLITSIAKAKRDNNYQEVITAHYQIDDCTDSEILLPMALQAGKEAFEKVNGRPMTDSDYGQIILPFIEKNINEWQERMDKQGYYDSFAEKIKYWKNEYNRYSGNNKYKTSSRSTTTSYAEPFGIIISIIISAVIAFISGTFLANFLYKFIPINPDVLSIGLVAAVFIVCMITCLNHKGLKIVKLAVILIGISAIGIIGAKALANKSQKPQTTQSVTITQQADITQNVNFRKDPSTGDNIIRQLKKGDTVTLTGEVVEGWTQLTHNGDTGWVSSEYLKVWGK
jgi:hypothetical protein